MAHQDRGQDSLPLQDDRISDGGSGVSGEAVPVYARQNSSPGEGMRRGTGLALVKDGDRKQVGFKCGTTVLRQREDTRLGGDTERSVGEQSVESSQPCRKGAASAKIKALEEARRLDRRIVMKKCVTLTLVIMLVATVAVLLPGCGSDTKQAKEYMQQGDRLVKQYEGERTAWEQSVYWSGTGAV